MDVVDSFIIYLEAIVILHCIQRNEAHKKPFAYSQTGKKKD